MSRRAAADRRDLRAGDFLTAKAAAVRAGRAHEAPRKLALEALRRRAEEAPPPPSFRAALIDGPTVGLIAEFKRRSPSAGRLTSDERPDDLAARYVESGAVAVSVLTDAEDFGGSLDDLAAAAARLGRAAPVLRKDFVVDRAGIYEARAAGAGAALLIAAVLDQDELHELGAAARSVGLECLVEVHDERELERALAAEAGVVGINNRNLRQMPMKTNLAVTERLAPRVPHGVLVVSESGIRSAIDVARLRDAGAHAVLVGEALLRLAPAARDLLARELASVPRTGRSR